MNLNECSFPRDSFSAKANLEMDVYTLILPSIIAEYCVRQLIITDEKFESLV